MAFLNVTDATKNKYLMFITGYKHSNNPCYQVPLSITQHLIGQKQKSMEKQNM